MSKTGYYTHPMCMKHEMGEGHPECPERLSAIQDRLLISGVDLGLTAMEAPEAPLADIERTLLLLEKFEIIDYEKQNGLAKLTLLSPRANLENLPIAWNSYLEKKERSRTKIEAIESYVRQNQVCRTTKIVAYFGETWSQTCGICDICIQKKHDKTGKSYPEGNEQERKLILHYLKNGPMKLQDLVDCLRPLSRSEATKVIQFGLESGEITYTDVDEIGLASS